MHTLISRKYFAGVALSVVSLAFAVCSAQESSDRSDNESSALRLPPPAVAAELCSRLVLEQQRLASTNPRYSRALQLSRLYEATFEDGEGAPRPASGDGSKAERPALVATLSMFCDEPADLAILEEVLYDSNDLFNALRRELGYPEERPGRDPVIPPSFRIPVLLERLVLARDARQGSSPSTPQAREVAGVDYNIVRSVCARYLYLHRSTEIKDVAAAMQNAIQQR